MANIIGSSPCLHSYTQRLSAPVQGRGIGARCGGVWPGVAPRWYSPRQRYRPPAIRDPRQP